jgi:hypothetical protein
MSTDLEDNRDKLKRPWSPDDEIETLWTCVSECRNFAAGTTEENPGDIAMRLLLIPLEKAGVLTLYVSEWNREATVDKTYSAFKLFFSDTMHFMQKLSRPQHQTTKLPMFRSQYQTSKRQSQHQLQ